MKKVLLLSACIASALAVSAQKAHMTTLPMPSKAELCKKAPAGMADFKSVAKLNSADVKMTSYSKAFKAAALDDVLGYYVEDGIIEYQGKSNDGGYPVVATRGEMEYTDGSTVPAISFDGLFQGAAKYALGVVETEVVDGEEVDMVYIAPGEFIAPFTFQDGSKGVMAAFAIKHPADDSGSFEIDGDEETGNPYWITYSINEDEYGRYLSCENEGWFVGVWREDPSVEGGYAYAGYWSYTYEPGTINFSNYACKYEETHVGNNSEWTEWAPVTEYIYAEDGGDMLTVKGVCGLFSFDIMLDEEEGMGYIPQQQVFPEGALGTGVPEFYVVGQHPETLWSPITNPDYETPVMYDPETGTIKHGYISEDGEIIDLQLAFAGQATPMNGGSSVSAYFYELLRGFEVGPLANYNMTNGAEAAGINTVVRPNSQPRHTYNLAGQRVENASLKGTYIEGGRKVIR